MNNLSTKEIVLSWIEQNIKSTNIKDQKDLYSVIFNLLLKEFLNESSEDYVEVMVDVVCLKHHINLSNISMDDIDDFTKKLLTKNRLD